jgi:hypothetical protein
MRTIRLELLRHGPAHNQLLSPLTEYLALCENHSAVSIRIPIEHSQLSHRLHALSYELGQEPRDFQLRDTAQVMGQLLGQIPGLTADLNQPCTQSGHVASTHLRLIISATELALLPFELALAPAGFPGAGQYLALQPQMPVCITRETRRVEKQYLTWPRRPKILFAFAQPDGYAPVPAQAHLLALRRAIAPWLSITEHTCAADRKKMVAERLHVLPNASVATLEDECAKGNYTHIHILAHGASEKTGDDTRYRLALHAKRNAGQVDLVSGARLATTLQAQREQHDRNASQMAVVTLASCNASNVGTIGAIGASISHDLHEAGIPLVIASQFPLSFDGSVMMVEKLYNDLLWGKDPRESLIDLRRSLHSHFTNLHDWASLTAYTTLPPDFDAQLADFRITRAKQALNATLNRADQELEQLAPKPAQQKEPKSPSANPQEPALTQGDSAKEESTKEDSTTNKDRLYDVFNQIRSDKQLLQKTMEEHPAQREKILAKLAGVSKREAQLQYHVVTSWVDRTEKEQKAVLDSMYESRRFYWETRFLEPVEAYKTVQYLSLTIPLFWMGKTLPIDKRPERDKLSLWIAAELQALNALTIESNVTRGWAWCDLAELYLLAPLVPDLAKLRPDFKFGEAAVAAATEVTILAGRSSYCNFSTRRQIHRYPTWYVPMMEIGGADKTLCEKINATAKLMLDAMPEGEEPEWYD